jgi:hypothetical protein
VQPESEDVMKKKIREMTANATLRELTHEELAGVVGGKEGPLDWSTGMQITTGAPQPPTPTPTQS